MPKVETITVGGITWRRYPNAKNLSDRSYFKKTFRDGTVVSLHRWVWKQHHGEIPEGCHIHHKDGDTGNNDISNLECLHSSDHLQGHAARRDWRSPEHLAHLERIRPLTKAWHASPEGREVHRKVGSMAYKNFTPDDKPCKHCGEVFTPRKLGSQDLFCSNKCKSAWRRASGVDDEKRICEWCRAEFTTNKNSKVRFCNRSCTMYSRHAGKS